MPDNISYLSVEERLKYVQDETIITMLPAIIFLIILGLTGLMGNSLVLIVYSKKYKWTSIKVFIMVIAVFDIIANVLAIPGEIYNMFHTWDFDKPTLCKARLFLSAYITVFSAFILVAIAVTRYRKICAPLHWQINVKEAKIVCLVVVILTGLVSSPFFVVFGRLTKHNTQANITGYECTTDDSYVRTIWPTVVYALLLAVFIGYCIPVCVLYTRIGIKAWKHSQMFQDSQISTHVTSRTTSDEMLRDKIQEQLQTPFQPVQNLSEHESSKTPTCQDHHTLVLNAVAISSEDVQQLEKEEDSRSLAPVLEDSSELKEASPQQQARQIRKPSVTIQEDTGEKHNTRNDDSDKPRPKLSLSTALMNTFRRFSNMSSMSDSPKRRLRKRPLRKTTVMLIVISAVFAFCYMPHFAAMFFKYLAPEQYEAMTRAGASVYNVCQRFYFFNCAANPIIYSLCDVKFRRECVSLFKCSSCNK